MKGTYELKQFKTSNSKELSKALKLYSENVEAAARTDTREILYWIDNFSKESDDSLFVLGFYMDDILIGYAQLAYFLVEKLIVVDYLVIEEHYRGLNTFYELIHRIKLFLLAKNIEINYVVGEVGCFFENQAPPESSQTLIRLLKMAKLGVVKTKHYVPRLGLKNYESEMIAVLMIYTSEGLKQLKTETYFSIIETIYYKYYQRWYKAFQNEQEKRDYTAMLERLFGEIRRFAGNKEVIEINGKYNLWEVDITYMQSVSNKKKVKLLVLALLVIILVLLIGGLGFLIQQKFGIDIDGQMAVLLISITAAFIIASAIFEGKSHFFSNLVEEILKKN
jgi:hypothetical protein